MTSEQSKKIKEQFERKLNDMQNELKKFKAAQKEHAKLVKNQSHYEKQLKTLQHELGEMKKTKVGLPIVLNTTYWIKLSAHSNCNLKMFSFFFFFFFYGKRFDILCKISPMETICMKHWIVFAGKKKKK